MLLRRATRENLNEEEEIIRKGSLGEAQILDLSISYSAEFYSSEGRFLTTAVTLVDHNHGGSMKLLRIFFLSLLLSILLLGSFTPMGLPAAEAQPFIDNYNSQPLLSDTEAAGVYYTNRYPPKVFESVDFGGDKRLHLEINQSDSQANRPPMFSSTFYNTQGREYLNAGASSIQIDLYVGNDWDTQFRRGDIWGVGVDNTQSVVAFPILGVTSQGGPLRFRVFDTGIGWVDLNHPIAPGQWYHLQISIACSGIQHRIDGELVYTDSNPGAAINFKSSIIQGYNFGDSTYDIYWDNLRVDFPSNDCLCQPGQDSDGDGISDGVESGVGLCKDSDLDGVPDYLDLDSDNDGITDAVECGSNSCPDTDQDALPDYLDLDSDDDGLLDLVEGGGVDADANGRADNFVDTNNNGLSDQYDPAAGGMALFPLPDSNGDGVPDVLQKPFSLAQKFYFVWNGFLDQTNIAVFYNRSDTVPVTVTIDLLDINGVQQSSSQLVLSAHQEFDLLVDALPGFSRQSYGLIRVNASLPGIVDGHMALYRSSPDGSEMEFTILREHQNSLTGDSFTVFNTNQPSQNPAHLGDVVLHWLQLANHDSSNWKGFTVLRYDSEGTAVSSTHVAIPPQGRRDVEAGHDDSILGRVGLVRVVPDDQGAPYGGELIRYGGNSPRGVFPGSFSFAIADNLEQGSGGIQRVSVTRGAGGVNYLELSNLDDLSETVSLKIQSNFGRVAYQGSFALSGKHQVHIPITAVFNPGEVGYAEITSLNHRRLFVKSSVYFYKPDASPSDAYDVSGRDNLQSAGSSVYNVYLGQFNWLKVFNSSAQNSLVTVEVFGASGNLLGSASFVLLAGMGTDLELRENLGFQLPSNTYGEIRVKSSVPNAVISDLLRIRASQDGRSIDVATQLPLR